MATHTVTMENFESIVDSHPIVILDFWAEWCAPCRAFSPVFESVSEHYPDIFFGKVNTEVATDLAEAFHIRSIPAIMAFKGGELVFEQNGIIPPQLFDKLIGELRQH